VLSDCGRRPGGRPPRQPGTADRPSPERLGGQRDPLRQGGAAGQRLALPPGMLAEPNPARRLAERWRWARLN